MFHRPSPPTAFAGCGFDRIDQTDASAGYVLRCRRRTVSTARAEMFQLRCLLCRPTFLPIDLDRFWGIARWTWGIILSVTPVILAHWKTIFLMGLDARTEYAYPTTLHQLQSILDGPGFSNNEHRQLERFRVLYAQGIVDDTDAHAPRLVGTLELPDLTLAAFKS